MTSRGAASWPAHNGPLSSSSLDVQPDAHTASDIANTYRQAAAVTAIAGESPLGWQLLQYNGSWYLQPQATHHWSPAGYEMQPNVPSLDSLCNPPLKPHLQTSRCCQRRLQSLPPHRVLGAASCLQRRAVGLLCLRQCQGVGLLQAPLEGHKFQHLRVAGKARLRQ